MPKPCDFGELPLGKRAEVGPPPTPGGAQGNVELQTVFEGSRAADGVALITINRHDREPQPRPKGEAALEEILVQLRYTLVEPFMDLELQRAAR